MDGLLCVCVVSNVPINESNNLVDFFYFSFDCYLTAINEIKKIIYEFFCFIYDVFNLDLGRLLLPSERICSRSAAAVNWWMRNITMMHGLLSIIDSIKTVCFVPLTDGHRWFRRWRCFAAGCIVTLSVAGVVVVRLRLAHQTNLIEAAVLTVGLRQPDANELLLPFHSDDVILWTVFPWLTLAIRLSPPLKTIINF